LTTVKNRSQIERINDKKYQNGLLGIGFLDKLVGIIDLPDNMKKRCENIK